MHNAEMNIAGFAGIIRFSGKHMTYDGCLATYTDRLVGDGQGYLFAMFLFLGCCMKGEQKAENPGYLFHWLFIQYRAIVAAGHHFTSLPPMAIIIMPLELNFYAIDAGD